MLLSGWGFLHLLGLPLLHLQQCSHLLAYLQACMQLQLSSMQLLM